MSDTIADFDLDRSMFNYNYNNEHRSYVRKHSRSERKNWKKNSKAKHKLLKVVAERTGKDLAELETKYSGRAYYKVAKIFEAYL
jgi:translation initiation factor 2 alpha subunit (eIF-2alpha)